MSFNIIEWEAYGILMNQDEIEARAEEFPEKEISMKDVIVRILSDVFDPLLLDVIDNSLEHKGHAGAPHGNETHFSLRIVSWSFAGKSRLQRHRMIHEALGSDVNDRIHALALCVRAPDETMD